MLKFTLIAASAIALAMAVPGLASAKSIKDLISPESLAKYCQTVGANTETTGSVTMPDGSTLAGTIHCEGEDLFVGTDDSSDHDGSDDSSDDDGTDDSSDDDGSDDSSDDEGSDDSSDDDGSDDESGNDDDSNESDDD